MAYYARVMRQEDVGQATEIDREAFSTQWPPPNYKRELRSRPSHYIVAINDARTAMVAEPQTAAPRIKYGRVAVIIRRWFGCYHAPNSPLKKESIIGLAGLWMIADEAHITTIAVREKYRRQRVGELLLIALTELATKLKAHTITLEVRVSNTVAQSLYTKYNFTRVGLRRGYYTDNREDALLMSIQDITSVAFQEHFVQLKRNYLGKLGEVYSQILR